MIALDHQFEVTVQKLAAAIPDIAMKRRVVVANSVDSAVEAGKKSLFLTSEFFHMRTNSTGRALTPTIFYDSEVIGDALLSFRIACKTVVTFDSAQTRFDANQTRLPKGKTAQVQSAKTPSKIKMETVGVSKLQSKHNWIEMVASTGSKSNAHFKVFFSS